MKNFVFISPEFPDHFYKFVLALKKNGIRVLGVGGNYRNNVNPILLNNIDEYYELPWLDNFNLEVNALRYYEGKYGHIDYIESNNEYWLQKDAQLRDIFHVETGPGYEQIQMYQHKSLMKKGYKEAKVKCADWILIDTFENAVAFAKKVGYPIFIKPDYGVGAEGDFKIKNEDDLCHFFDVKMPGVTYICEQFVTGNIISFDGIADSNNNVVFAASNFFPPSIADVVQQKQDVFYYTLPHVPKDLLEIGKRVVKAFKVKQRYFHMEFFRLTEDAKSLAKKGEIVALETNMRPAGGYTPDLVNFANSVDSYQVYADVIAFDENRQKDIYDHYFAACASRRDGFKYLHSDEEVLEKYKNCMASHGRYAPIFSGAMGDRYFMAKFKTEEEMYEFRDYAEARAE